MYPMKYISDIFHAFVMRQVCNHVSFYHVQYEASTVLLLSGNVWQFRRELAEMPKKRSDSEEKNNL